MNMSLTSEQLLAIIIAVVAAPGFWNLLQALMEKLAEKIFGTKKISNEEIGAKLDVQGRKIDALEEAFYQKNVSDEEKEIKAARRRILRADDELRIGIKHSKDFFEDILRDIDYYEAYCDSHPHFKNRVAESAIHNVADTYDHCKAANDFL